MANDELRVDILRCDAYGLCAELLPEMTRLGERGYPLVRGEGTPELRGEAKSALGRARLARPGDERDTSALFRGQARSEASGRAAHERSQASRRNQ
jgi:ferredoxin